MKKRGITYKIFRTVLAALCLPFILLVFTAIALHIPVIQQYATERIFGYINDKSDYEIKAGIFRLKFPLNIEISDFKVTKEDSVYAKGKNIGANIALLPLFTGNIEINYMTVEESYINSRELIPDVKIKGNIGYLRAVARSINPQNRTAALRQIYILDSDIAIELADTVKKQKEKNNNWKITLHKGMVNNSNVKLSIPDKAISYSLSLNHLQLKQGEIDLGKKLYSTTSLYIKSSKFQYRDTKKKGNIKSLSLTNVNATTKHLFHSSQKSNMEISDMQFTAPGNIEITQSSAIVTTDSTGVLIKDFLISSNNGSYINATAYIPYSSIKPEGKENFNGEISLSLNKNDFRNLFTKEQQKNLDIFKENILTGTFIIAGNTKECEFRSNGIEIPSLVSLEISGCFENGSNEQVITVNSEMYMKERKGKIATQTRYCINNNSYKAFLAIREFGLSSIFPNIPLEYANATLQAEGKGFDILNDATTCNINISLDSVVYDEYTLCDIKINAAQERGCATANIEGDKTTITKGEKSFTIDDITLAFATDSESTHLALKNGDLNITGNLEYNYKELLGLADNNRNQHSGNFQSWRDYTKELPAMQLDFSCGEKNVLYNFLTANGMSIKNLDLRLRADSMNGIKINGEILDFKKDNIKLDTIRVLTQQHDDTIKYITEIYSTAIDFKKEKQSYKAALQGNLFNDTLTTFFSLCDSKNNVYAKFGTKAGATVEDISIAFVQDAVFLDNRFVFNENNFIRIDNKGSVKVNVTLGCDSITYRGKQTEYRTMVNLIGEYINKKETPILNGSISIKEFPLELINILVKDSNIILDGYINSNVTFNKAASELTTEGFVQFNKARLNAPQSGTELHLSDTPINIAESKILFKNFNIYAKGENPFVIDGYIDMSTITSPEFNLKMKANNYEIVNTPRQADAMLYGKLSVDIATFIEGTPEKLNIEGKAAILSNSNITYVLQSTPISSKKELDGVVEFVSFADTTVTNKSKKNIDIGNVRINMALKVDNGARLNVDFDKNRNNYLTLQGSGNLNMSYNHETGFIVTGGYTMEEGELKYQLPIIPLKTFRIKNGSKVIWNGDIKNPTLEITALEKVITSVTFDDDGIQPVVFDVGVKLSNTLENMGLSFVISAPDNAIVQDQLNSLDEESMNKYAITMLITGAYIGNSNSMAVSNALNSLLDAKINELASSAIKSISVNIGINDARNPDTGNTYKNYSFSLRKRFRNDRITIVIGGELNSENNLTNNESFINKASLEWKIGNSGNKYIKLFYDKNYESLLEGEITEGGIGYLYKRKLGNLKELFIFKNKKAEETTPSGKRKERQR